MASVGAYRVWEHYTPRAETQMEKKIIKTETGIVEAVLRSGFQGGAYPCSLLGVIWVLPGYIGVYKAYIRVI